MKFLPALALLGITFSVAHADVPAPVTAPAPTASASAAASPVPASAPIGNARASAAKNAPLICPVSGETIASPKAAYNSEVYKGKTYYFCCPDCKPAFDKNPSKYVKSAAAHKS